MSVLPFAVEKIILLVRRLEVIILEALMSELVVRVLPERVE